MAAHTQTVAQRLEAARRLTDHAIGERNRVLALLATHYPAHVIPVPDSRPDWRHAVCIHLPSACVAWKLHDDEIALEFSFLHVEPVNGCDRHTVLDKLDRLGAAIEARQGELTYPVVLKRKPSA